MMTWGSEDAEMAKTQEAMYRAAERAREIARRFGTPLVIWRDGRIVHLSPDEAGSPRPTKPGPVDGARPSSSGG
jgi:hypothetical protein